MKENKENLSKLPKWMTFTAVLSFLLAACGGSGSEANNNVDINAVTSAPPPSSESSTVNITTEATEDPNEANPSLVPTVNPERTAPAPWITDDRNINATPTG